MMKFGQWIEMSFPTDSILLQSEPIPYSILFELANLGVPIQEHRDEPVENHWQNKQENT